MSEVRGGIPTSDMMAAQDRSDTARAARETALAAQNTQLLTERLLHAQTQLVDAQQQLLAAQTDAEKREVKMLSWTRVAGIGAVAALAVSIVAIVVTLLAT